MGYISKTPYLTCCSCGKTEADDGRFQWITEAFDLDLTRPEWVNGQGWTVVEYDAPICTSCVGAIAAMSDFMAGNLMSDANVLDWATLANLRMAYHWAYELVRQWAKNPGAGREFVYESWGL